MKRIGEKLAVILRTHSLIVTLGTGSAAIGAWTLLRFFTDKSIFDLVGQQVFARQLMEYGVGDATLGATHYLLKVFFVYIPFELLHLSPRVGLVIMTLLVNIVSYILIVLLTRAILGELKVRVTRLFYIASLWLAVSAGSVFWIEFTNSRNLEVAGGLAIIYLGLRLFRQISWRAGVSLGLVSILVFYSDPLQVFMTAAPLLMYVALLRSASMKDQRGYYYRLFTILGIFIGAYFVGKWVLRVSQDLLHVNFVDTGASFTVLLESLRHISQMAGGFIAANIRLFGGVLDDGGRLRQVIAISVIAITLIIWLWAVYKRRLTKRVVVFVATFWILIEAVYVMSGQASGGDTSRYLIMLAPLFIIVVSSLPAHGRLGKFLTLSLGATVLMNGIVVAVLLMGSWQQRFSRDAPLANTASYVASHHDVRFYSSMDTALTTTYYYPSTTILPLACANHMLEESSMFYSQTAFRVGEMKPADFDGIIVDSGQQITNYPNICSLQDIEAQIGSALRIESLSDKAILIYPAGQLRRASL